MLGTLQGVQAGILHKQLCASYDLLQADNSLCGIPLQQIIHISKETEPNAFFQKLEIARWHDIPLQLYTTFRSAELASAAWGEVYEFQHKVSKYSSLLFYQQLRNHQQVRLFFVHLHSELQRLEQSGTQKEAQRVLWLLKTVVNGFIENRKELDVFLQQYSTTLEPLVIRITQLLLQWLRRHQAAPHSAIHHEIYGFTAQVNKFIKYIINIYNDPAYIDLIIEYIKESAVTDNCMQLLTALARYVDSCQFQTIVDVLFNHPSQNHTRNSDLGTFLSSVIEHNMLSCPTVIEAAAIKYLEPLIARRTICTHNCVTLPIVQYLVYVGSTWLYSSPYVLIWVLKALLTAKNNKNADQVEYTVHTLLSHLQQSGQQQLINQAIQGLDVRCHKQQQFAFLYHYYTG